jgi:hypothetical protein
MQVIKRYFIEIILIITTLSISTFLMWHTFSYHNSQMMIASKVWSDFASHVPLIRSFSMGENFPPEDPLFFGEPIRYHFGFFFIVGLLERLGLRIDYALNIPSIIGFSLLMISIYWLGTKISGKKSVGVLAVLFFLCNSSLSFLEYFRMHPFSFDSLTQIFSNTTYPSFGPYDHKEVSAFWNLNIYTNQRHFPGAIAVLLFMTTYLTFAPLHSKKHPIIVGVLAAALGLMPFFHTTIFIIACIMLGVLFLLLPQNRWWILLVVVIGGLIASPRMLGLNSSTPFHPQIVLGYLASPNVTLYSFLHYWWVNLGILPLLAIIGFYFSNYKGKAIFLSVLPLFIIPNIIQFSPEMAGNHKFFNIFVIIMNIFAAVCIMKLFKASIVGKLIAPILVFIMTFSGFIDLFPLINDGAIGIVDIPQNPVATWITQNTSPNSGFLNHSYLYDNASIAGRKIYSGWPYFTWSVGHDSDFREQMKRTIFAAADKNDACKLLSEQHIDYIELDNPADSNLPYVSQIYTSEFNPLYENQSLNVKIFSVKDNCQI